MKGLLLTGGASQRMGQDKATLELKGVPMWQRQLLLLQKTSQDSVAVAAPQRPAWLPHEVEWIADCGTQGPLGGILAGLRWAQSPLLVLAVDMPRMSSVCLEALSAHLKNGEGVVPVKQGRFEPLAAIYPYDALAAGEKQARSGDFALHRWITEIVAEEKMAPWSVPDAYIDCFLNVNTPQEWQSHLS